MVDACHASRDVDVCKVSASGEDTIADACQLRISPKYHIRQICTVAECPLADARHAIRNSDVRQLGFVEGIMADACQLGAIGKRYY